MDHRNRTRRVWVGDVPVGGGAAVSIQSMTSTSTTDTRSTIDQIKRLEEAGCDIVRVGVPDQQSVRALESIVAEVSCPVVADIHFDYRLALAACEAGAAKLRINPGNIGGRDRVEKVVARAKACGIPIRIGVNAGSLESDILVKYGHPTAEAMVESVMRHLAILEEMDFRDIVISLKASSVPLTISAYRLMAQRTLYPLHIGISEAGWGQSGAVYSAVGLGILLHEGIGDTLRVSLTDDPVEEVRVAAKILAALELRNSSPRIISCPTCARNHLDLIAIAREVERRVGDIRAPIKIAVMGCAVNGPGEAREADFGIAGGEGTGLIFVKGEIVKKVPEKDLVDELEREIRKALEE